MGSENTALATDHSATVTLQGDTGIVITREFAAPRHLVWKAYTTPELIKRWWSGERGEVTLAEVDLRVGGRWRYVMVADGGFEVGFHGEYREVETNEKLVMTEVFEGMPDGEALDTVTFTEVDGRTTLTMLVEHTEAAHRDAHIGSGMEGGMQESMDRLERVANSLA
ncbi:SRPBCC family protein [Pseudonocardia sp. N23]|uniref:SRPBCC family protein n=1 Tax=Pseudonocardia sp. N23 TaxID=1987376 RepID=UPI000BFEA8E7|nr:SRPBCC family protein [Pseudonocardia sp. N23]